MRVVSLVPSLTETLIECGVEVVGRTRYCLHPQDRVKAIPILGGTKDLDWQKFSDARPDLLVLDREENLPWMREKCPCPVHVLHVQSLSTLTLELRRLAEVFSGESHRRLKELALRCQRVELAPSRNWSWDLLPAEMRRAGVHRNWTSLLYLIWKDPWMSVSRETFIGSVFQKLGGGPHWPAFTEKYPKLDLSQFDPEITMLLMSSEPYPFGKKWADSDSLPFTRALIDGEKVSWFGLRSLRFLEEELNLSRD